MRSKKVTIGLVIIVSILLCFSSTVPGSALDDWEDGDEKKYTGGRSFDDEFWVADYKNTTTEGNNLTSSIFYMNSHNVQAFLVAIKDIRNETNVGVVPYQLFGLHYYSPEGQEVFIGAMFAFLMGYNNTYDPETGSKELDPNSLFYIIPFGAASLVKENYVPTVDRKVERIDDTHYVFEISYKNLYAFVTKSIFWSAVLKTGWIAKFTELTIRYKITMDEDNGEVRAETFYTLGQVTELWAFFLGVPIQVDVTQIPETLGVAAVHYVATFTSYSRIVGAATNHTINTGITEPADEDIGIEIENKERVFKIGFRGTYDLLDETQSPPAELKTDEKAINILLKTRPSDILLILWQLGFSADLMAVMSYGISDTLQDKFDSPRDLKQKTILNFHVNTLWYVVGFPEWGGYRIEHDPTYTAYTSFEVPPIDDSDDGGPCGTTMIILLATTASVCVVGYRRRRRR
ncbi:hypothetical protein [[Eubacterium] cellulosolvens]